MTTFKPGDRVRRLSNFTGYISKRDDLVKDGVYTVDRVDRGNFGLYLEGKDPRFSYSPEQFVLIEASDRKIQVGDKVTVSWEGTVVEARDTWDGIRVQGSAHWDSFNPGSASRYLTVTEPAPEPPKPTTLDLIRQQKIGKAFKIKGFDFTYVLLENDQLLYISPTGKTRISPAADGGWDTIHDTIKEV